MALDQATTAFLTQMGEMGIKPLHEMTPGEARALTAGLKDMYGSGPDLASSSDEMAGDVPVRVLVPHGTPRGVILYYHGGGWVIGALDEFDTLGRQLAERTQCVVVLVDYRMAPEHRYPAAVEDAWTALLYAANTIAAEGMPIVVAGDSAGGNLAAIVAQRARATGPALAAQVLVYPVTDADLDNDTYTDPANQLMLSRDAMVWFWDLYAPEHADRANPDASPAKASDLSGLPPAIVLTAEHDVLRQEGEAYAAALQAAGVPVVQRRFDGQMHGFFTFVNVLPGQADGLDFVVTELDRLLFS